jgi:Co/Zn/Cd efflux system component
LADHLADLRRELQQHGKLGDLAGFTSAIILAMIAILIGYESISRIFSPVSIHFAEAIPIACLGLAVNITSAWLLSGDEHGHSHERSNAHRDNNIRAAVIHVLARFRSLSHITIEVRPG